jgi:ribosomal protein S1
MALKQFGDDFNDLDSFITNVQKGDTVKGFVNGYSDFGAFVTLGERQHRFSYISTIKALVPMQ